MISDKHFVVFYDGDCGFCNHSVQFILKNRKHDNFRFLTLQSKLGEQILSEFSVQITLETIFVLHQNKVKQKSDAVLLLSKELKGIYPLLQIGYILPRFLRDGLYSFIARNRHKLQKKYCIIPAEDDKKLFLS